jgi:phenylacetic acid degradation operon negative regulatory protein
MVKKRDVATVATVATTATAATTAPATTTGDGTEQVADPATGDGAGTRDPDGLQGEGLRPLNARSVLASTLLGTHPPELPVAALVRTAAAFGISPGSTRVALSRMVARGELENLDGRYRLTGALAARQVGLDESRSPRLVEWDGSWIVLVIDDSGRDPETRRIHRRHLVAARLGELREGVWLRPANIADADTLLGGLAAPATAGHGDREGTGEGLLDGTGTTTFLARPTGNGADLAAAIFDLARWAGRARALLQSLENAGANAGADAAPPGGAPGPVTGPGIDLAAAFSLDAAVLRHLRADPLLPETLEPPAWPAGELRARFAEFDRVFRRQWRAWVGDR